jgi:AcrR family transcriptional regulator
VSVTSLDRAAAVRQALRRLVAQRGFHGASMSAIAAEAGVATGTAYTHYGSKDELILAAYLETKAQLGAAATAELDPAADPAERFRSIWLASYRHLADHPDHALFLLQVDCSPYRPRTHEAALEQEGDPILEQAADPAMTDRLLPLRLEVLYELGLAPSIRLAANGMQLRDAELEAIADACWRAISRPGRS